MGNIIEWEVPQDIRFDDILYHQAEGIAKITINRPQVRNAFRPKTVYESLVCKMVFIYHF